MLSSWYVGSFLKAPLGFGERDGWHLVVVGSRIPSLAVFLENARVIVEATYPINGINKLQPVTAAVNGLLRCRCEEAALRADYQEPKSRCTMHKSTFQYGFRSNMSVVVQPAPHAAAIPLHRATLAALTHLARRKFKPSTDASVQLQ